MNCNMFYFSHFLAGKIFFFPIFGLQTTSSVIQVNFGEDVCEARLKVQNSCPLVM